jgi:hypothetical protein
MNASLQGGVALVAGATRGAQDAGKPADVTGYR